MSLELYGERFALISPFERFGHGLVEVVDEGQDFSFQVLDGSEVSAFEQFPNQDTEPDFDLIHPGSMFGRVVKDDSMGRVG